MNLATRRLIDAAATLPAADRALLSLWTQRGLDDEAMARMTGMSPAAIVERRERIVSALSDELGLPPHDISDALAAIAGSAAPVQPVADASAPTQNPETAADDTHATEPHAQVDHATESHTPVEPAPESDAQVEPAPESDAQVDQVAGPHAQVDPSASDDQARPQPEAAASATDPTRRDSRRLRVVVGLLLLALVAVIAIVLLAGGGSRGSAHGTTTRSTAPASGPKAASTGAPATGATPSAPPAALAPLPGGDPHALGTVTLAGSGASQKLEITVHGLPAPGAGYYEVFLYDSIIDSEPLGALNAGGRGTFRVPGDAAHYASIDISHQVSGDPLPDGASVLRARNPAHRAP